MKKSTLYITLIVAFFASVFNSSHTYAASVTAKATLDSAYIMMGKQTALHVAVSGEFSENGRLVTVDSLWKDVEIISMGEPEIKDLGNNRRELLQDVIIQAFDSGLYVIPPFMFVDGTTQVATDSPALKVVPVAVDSLVTVHDFSDVVNPDYHFFDFVPDWMSDYGIWILLTIIVLGIILFVYLKWLRHGRIPLVPAKKPVPPFEMAMSQLRKLHDEHLCEKGEEKQYYTRLTEILRVYLEKRFGINAMEMTTRQIKDAVSANETTKPHKALVDKVLEVADFVKFAKVRPLPDDNKRAFEGAVRFVEETKPVEQPEENAEKSNERS